MTILSETARLVKERLALEYEDITIERLVVGVFLTGSNYPTEPAGSATRRLKMLPRRFAAQFCWKDF